VHDSGAAIQRRAEVRPAGRRRRVESLGCERRESRGGWSWSRWQSPPRPPQLTSCPLGWPAAQGSQPIRKVIFIYLFIYLFIIDGNHACGTGY